MTEAVIVSTARTGIGKAFRGSLNITHGANHGRPCHQNTRLNVPALIQI